MNNRLVSGEHYSLEELLNYSENSKIVMPDLQRDYCWGGKDNLVYDFVNNIKNHYNEFNSLISESNEKCDNCELYKSKIIEDGKLTMGLVYGYYETYRPYLQLCDGQQRLTTLFLLIGLINRRCGTNPFQHLLISDFELNDDKEPNLLYSIRDSSLYFLSDLVSDFFLKNVSESGDFKKPSDVIKQCDWWFADYEMDPTIKSMLSAMDTIDELLPDNLDQLQSFGEYIQNQLLFIFYDMGDRQNGEETFVIINTTGEPLTATENLKPLIVTKDDSEYQTVGERSEKWEEIENWFWKNRADDDDTADNGMYEFLRLVAGVYSKDKDSQPNSDYYQLLQQDRFIFPYADIELNKIFKLYEAIKDIKTNSNPLFERLCPLLSIPLKKTKYELNEYFIILPVLYYKLRFKDASLLQIKRVYSFFNNLKLYTDIRVDNNNLVHALHAIDKLPNIDICSLLNVKDEINTTYILTPEEEMRLRILRNAGDKRENIEDSFENFSAHKIINGRISYILQWSGGEDNFDFTEFTKYRDIFEETFKGECDSEIDNVRRALITRHLKNYPCIFNGYKNYSFGWDWENWEELISNNVDEFKSFFDDRINGVTLKQMIEEYPNQAYLSEFVKNDFLLNYCEEKNIQNSNLRGWNLIKKKYATTTISVKNMILYHYLEDIITLPEGWNISPLEGDNDGGCVNIGNDQRDIHFVIYYEQTSDGTGHFVIEVFKNFNSSKNQNKSTEGLECFIDNWEEADTPYSYRKIVDFNNELVRTLIMDMITKLGS